MKEKIRKRFILKSAIVLIAAAIIAYFILPYFSEQLRWFILLLPVIAFLINMLSFFASSGKIALKNFNIQISFLFGTKFFSYLLLSLLFFLNEPSSPARIIFISFIFMLYLLNTVVLLTDIMKFHKTASNSH